MLTIKTRFSKDFLYDTETKLFQLPNGNWVKNPRESSKGKSIGQTHEKATEIEFICSITEPELNEVFSSLSIETQSLLSGSFKEFKSIIDSITIEFEKERFELFLSILVSSYLSEKTKKYSFISYFLLNRCFSKTEEYLKKLETVVEFNIAGPNKNGFSSSFRFLNLTKEELSILFKNYICLKFHCNVKTKKNFYKEHHMENELVDKFNKMSLKFKIDLPYFENYKNFHPLMSRIERGSLKKEEYLLKIDYSYSFLKSFEENKKKTIQDDFSGRVYTFYTKLSSYDRKFISPIEPFKYKVDIDLASAVPTLLAYSIKDPKFFTAVIKSRNFYKTLKYTGKRSYKSIKKLCCSAWFSKNNSRAEKLLEKSFPEAIAELRELKKEDPNYLSTDPKILGCRDFAKTMLSKEVEIFKPIWEKLFELGILFQPKHDSITFWTNSEIEIRDIVNLIKKHIAYGLEKLNIYNRPVDFKLHFSVNDGKESIIRNTKKVTNFKFSNNFEIIKREDNLLEFKLKAPKNTIEKLTYWSIENKNRLFKCQTNSTAIKNEITNFNSYVPFIYRNVTWLELLKSLKEHLSALDSKA